MEVTNIATSEKNNMIILVTGSNGLVGKAMQTVAGHPSSTWIFTTREDANLENEQEVDALFAKHNPTHVVHLAAYVGGLFHNMKEPVAFFEKNMLMQINIMRACQKYKVKRVINCLSTCIFPAKVQYPLTEEMLHNGAPHSSNFAYAYSKRMMEVLSRAYEQQYGLQCISICPTNVYGPNDNFSIANGHVLPALIHKAYIAAKEGTRLCCWGTGKPLREFIYSEDLARYIEQLVYKQQVNQKVIIISSGFEFSIANVAEMVANAFGVEIEWDTCKSDGQFRKPTCIKKLLDELGPLTNPKATELRDGIRRTVEWFNNNYKEARK